MNANELRIGNYVNTPRGFKRVTNISVDGYCCFLDEEVTPIPLTEEWLLKFGFTKKLGNWELPNFRFHVNKPMNFDGFLFCEGYSVTTDKIQFVHQLQNLIFELTGEELIFNQ